MNIICFRHGLVPENSLGRCGKCNSLHVSNKRRELKKKAIQFLGGKCTKCGYDKCIAALGFHHRDPSKKDFTISKGVTYGWEKVKVEIKKCDLLCSNCHAELHHELEEVRQKSVNASLAPIMSANERKLVRLDAVLIFFENEWSTQKIFEETKISKRTIQRFRILYQRGLENKEKQ